LLVEDLPENLLIAGHQDCHRVGDLLGTGHAGSMISVDDNHGPPRSAAVVEHWQRLGWNVRLGQVSGSELEVFGSVHGQAKPDSSAWSWLRVAGSEDIDGENHDDGCLQRHEVILVAPSRGRRRFDVLEHSGRILIRTGETSVDAGDDVAERGAYGTEKSFLDRRRASVQRYAD
jgi:hypothetical protein